MVLIILFGFWLTRGWNIFLTGKDQPKLESRLVFSQRLGLAGLYADGPFAPIQPLLLKLALLVESDPRHIDILNGLGKNHSLDQALSPEYRLAARYQQTKTPEALFELRALAYQGLQRVALCTLLGFLWLCLASALVTWPKRAKPPIGAATQSLLVCLGVFATWEFLRLYLLTPFIRGSLLKFGSWTALWSLQILSGLLLMALVLLARNKNWRPLQTPDGRAVGQGLWLCLLGILGMETLIRVTTGVDPFTRNPTLGILLDADGTDLAVFVLWAVLVGPFLEELLFRGWLLSGLEQSLGPTRALLVSSAVFAFAHGSFWNAPGQFVGGLILGSIAQRTGSITSSWIIHGGWNAFWLIRVLASAP